MTEQLFRATHHGKDVILGKIEFGAGDIRYQIIGEIDEYREASSFTDLRPVKVVDMDAVNVLIRNIEDSIELCEANAKLQQETGILATAVEYRVTANTLKNWLPCIKHLFAQLSTPSEPKTAKMTIEVSVLVIPPAELAEKLRSLKVLIRRDGDNSIINGACMDIDGWIEQLTPPLAEPKEFTKTQALEHACYAVNKRHIDESHSGKKCDCKAIIDALTKGEPHLYAWSQYPLDLINPTKEG